MEIERERKFLLLDDSWKSLKQASINIEQFYVAIDLPTVLRVRKYGSEHLISLKSAVDQITSFEFNKPITASEFYDLKKISKNSPIHKDRHVINFEGMIWHIDEFLDHNRGLFLAEIEFEENDEVPLPPWVGIEVTTDIRYNNAYLSRHKIVPTD
mgnify:CR=1 FL=1